MTRAFVVTGLVALGGLGIWQGQTRATGTVPKLVYVTKATAVGIPGDLQGTYYFGDGLGVNCSLVLTKDNFTFRWTGCMGEYDKNAGPARMEGNLLVLSPKRPNSREGFQGTATRFYPIRWSKRIYLVGEEQMLGFCGKVRGGWQGDEFDGRSAFYYLRIDTPGMFKSLKELKGKPVVPSSYERYLKEPFVTRVVSTGKTFTVDKGRADGLAPMAFLSDKAGEWYRVEKSAPGTSTCKLWTAKRAPKVGLELLPVTF